MINDWLTIEREDSHLILKEMYSRRRKRVIPDGITDIANNGTRDVLC